VSAVDLNDPAVLRRADRCFTRHRWNRRGCSSSASTGLDPTRKPSFATGRSTGALQDREGNVSRDELREVDEEIDALPAVSTNWMT
jgi:hypothetical protein